MPVEVIKGADYSANNVGQIEVPITWDASLVPYIAQIPNALAAMSYAKQKALNQYVKALKSNNIFSKITQHYLPILGRQEGGVNLINPTQNIGFPNDNSIATYDSKGVKFLLGWIHPLPPNWNSIHAGFYNTTANSADTANRIGISKGSSSFFIAGRRTSAANSGTLLDSNYRAQVTNHVGSIGPVIGVLDASAMVARTIVDAEYKGYQGTAAISIPPTSNTILGGVTSGTNASILDSSIGLFTFGTALTESELSIYAALQTNLMTALLAA